jgi:hypothetical protein
MRVLYFDSQACASCAYMLGNQSIERAFWVVSPMIQPGMLCGVHALIFVGRSVRDDLRSVVCQVHR